MADTYANYAALATAQVLDTDYQISLKERISVAFIFAIHGGGIEMGTTEIVKGITDDDYAWYLFEGLKTSGNSVLHITSTNFDEPQLMGMLEKYSKQIAIHGASGTELITYVGGLNTKLKQLITEELTNAGFTTSVATGDIAGTEKRNVCNRAVEGVGVQLEITTAQRSDMFGTFSGAANRWATRNATFFAYTGAIIKAIKRDSTSNELLNIGPYTLPVPIPTVQ